MAIDKLLPRKLNKSDDFLMLKQVDAIDMVNVRIGSDNDGNSGIIKNAYGNAVVSGTIPSGETSCLGGVVNNAKNEVFFFLWNANPFECGIYKYDGVSESCRVVLKSNAFEFLKDDFIQADVLIDGNSDTLLMFTTGRGEPYMINASRAERGGYGLVSSISEPLENKRKYITLSKQPPLHPPTFKTDTDTTKNFNFINGNMFQFAAQYVYVDGQVSALSPYSKIAYTQSSVVYERLLSPNSDTNENVINVTIDGSNCVDVQTVRFFARQGNTGNFQEIGNVKNTASKVTVKFYNDQIYKTLAPNEENKLFDAVPTDVAAIRYSNNRIFCGDYIEGFDNVSINVNSVVNRDAESKIYNFTSDNLRVDLGGQSSNTKGNAAYMPSTSVIGTVRRLGVQFDLSEFPDTLDSGTTIVIDFTINNDRIEYVTASPTNVGGFYVNSKQFSVNSTLVANFNERLKLYNEPFRIKRTITLTQNETKASVATLIENALTNRTFTTNVKPDTTNNNAGVKALEVGGSDDYVLWLAGTVGGRFFKSPDVGAGTDFVNFDFAVYESALTISRAIRLKAFGNQEDVKITQSSVPNSIFIGTSAYNPSGQPNKPFPVFINHWTAFMGNSAITPSSVEHFKTNATHSFGIQYEDNRLRRSAVLPITPVYISPITTNSEGAASVSFILNHTPPDWASKYQMMYAGNQTYDFYEQYSVAEAFAASSSSGDGFGSIFLAMRQLEGKPSSFVDSKSARVSYSYAEGDKVRVIRYKRSENGIYGNVYVDDIEFDVLDYRFFDVSDAEININNDYRQTGWFLVVRDKEYGGWSTSDISTNTDNWKYDTIIEIYRPKKQASEIVYREIGSSYDIATNGITGQRYHKANVRDSSMTVTFDVIVSGDSTNGWTLQSSIELYPGEVFSFVFETATRQYTVKSCVKVSDTLFNITVNEVISGDTFNNPGSTNTGTLVVLKSIVKVVGGDSYLRPRLIKVNATYTVTDPDFTNVAKYEYQNVEAQTLSDYFDSKYYSYGKPNAASSSVKRVRRKATITYSDTYLIDSEVLGLSSFNNSLANWVDYDNSYGGIRYMVRQGDSFTVIQERKVSQVPIGRSLLEYSDGKSVATVSTDVIGSKPAYYSGDYGCNDNDESVAIDDFGRVYFVDARQRKVLRVDGSSLKPISDIDMDTFFNDLFGGYNRRSSSYRIYGAYDPDTAEYIISMKDLNSATITVGELSYKIPYDSGVIPADYAVDDNAIISVDEEARFAENICENVEDWGASVYFVDEAVTNPTVYVGSGYVTPSTTTFKTIVTNRTYDFFLLGTYNIAGKYLTIDAQTCEYDAHTITEDSAIEGETIGFNTEGEYWTTRYSFRPDWMVSFNDTLFTFANNQSSQYKMWKHSEFATRNNFYGTQYTMIVDAVSKYDPSKVKYYKAVSVEGNATYTSLVYTEDQETAIPSTGITSMTAPLGTWKEHENNYYSILPRSKTNNWSNYTFVGAVLNATGTIWIFDYGRYNDDGIWLDTSFWSDVPVAGTTATTVIELKNNINRIPIPTGVPIYRVRNGVATLTNMVTNMVFGQNRLTFTTVTPATSVTHVTALTEDDMIYIDPRTRWNGTTNATIDINTIDGDYMRGKWMRSRMTFPQTTPIEVYGMNFVYQTSRLHNELGEVNTE